MKKINCLFITLFVLSLSVLSRQKTLPPRQIPDQYIVILKESSAKPVIKEGKKNEDREQRFKDNNQTRENHLKKLTGLRSRRNIKEENIKHNYTDAIVGFTAKLSKEEKEALLNDPDVESISPDYELCFILPPAIKTDPTPLNPGDCFLNVVGGAADGTTNRKLLWILDTGIDIYHPDLNVVSKGPYPASFTGGPITDQDGHGTHIAGIAAAKNNGIGMTGVCAGARVVPVNVIAPSNSTYNTSYSTLLAGLNHVAEYAVAGDVVNLSLGGQSPVGCPNTSYPVTNAIRALGESGVFVCIAAGNDGVYASSQYPGCIDGTRIVTVGAINCNKASASYSNYGAGVDYVAVGTNVYSCYKNGGYATLSGTSMATPVVAGILLARGWPVSGPLVNCNGTMTPIATR